MVDYWTKRYAGDESELVVTVVFDSREDEADYHSRLPS